MSAGDKSNKHDGEYFSKCYEMLPRNWSAPCELGEMIYKFRFTVGTVFNLLKQVISRFFARDYTNGKKFQYCQLHVTETIKTFCYKIDVQM